MTQKIAESISVSLNFDGQRKKVFPRWLVWRGRLYPVSRVGLHHTLRKGNVLFHVFSVTAKAAFFRLSFNTQNLHWTLEEVSDGLPE